MTGGGANGLGVFAEIANGLAVAVVALDFSIGLQVFFGEGGGLVAVVEVAVAPAAPVEITLAVNGFLGMEAELANGLEVAVLVVCTFDEAISLV